MIGLIGHKGEMCQIFDDRGVVRPVTAISVPDCIVVRKRTKDTDGYEAVQLGAGKISKRRSTKPTLGYFKKAGVEPRNVLMEFDVDKLDDFQIGQKVGVDGLKPGDKVMVSGITKGRGFTGGMKRWGWHGGNKTHGSTTHRRIGSLGSGTTPGRPLKGRTAAGHYGVERVTVRNLRVVKVEADKGVIFVEGAVPGCRGGVVSVRKD